VPGSGVSVVIPSYESWSLLERTLAAVLHDVARLDAPGEVLLVDNDSGPELRRAVERRFGSSELLRVFHRSGLGERKFQPGAARNTGIEHARFDRLVFLDADCVPVPELLAAYARGLKADPGGVLIGHRVFVDPTGVPVGDRDRLAKAPHVASASNYGHVEDRRLPELRELERHPRPYDCLFACNFAIHRRALEDLRFRAAYDGHWGYEDIDLGYRLHLAGCRFRYVPEAFVLHQEGGDLSAEDRLAGRRRNLPILADAIPGFEAYRARSVRPGSA
jgi:GT2 family glycosyltransferase